MKTGTTLALAGAFLYAGCGGGGSSAIVHRSLSDVRTLGPDDALDGEDVLPGWSCPLASIL